MWARHLLFIGLVAAAAVALRAGLLPPRVADARQGAAADVSRARAEETAGVVGDVDRLFRRDWAEEGWVPAPRASELALLRRLALALTGAIPSLEEIRRFEAQPPSQAGRLAGWLDGVLRDRRFADYFAERLARVFVGTEDGPFLLYRRRRFVTWLSDELMANRPYDQLVRTLIAGDGLWTDRPSTNFVTVTFDPAVKRPDPERLAARTARAFLGLRIDCAQCHDHPFQPWKQADFQGLAAFYGQARSGFTGIRDLPGEFAPVDRKTGAARAVAPRVPFLPELRPEHGGRREQLAGWVTDPRNRSFARAAVNRVWALVFGRPLVEPVDDLPAEADLPAPLVRLADDFAAHGFDLARLIRVIAATEAFQRESATTTATANPETDTEAADASWSVFPMTRLRPEQVAGSLFQAASLETIDRDSPVLVRLAASFGEQTFVRRYGDTGEDEFDTGCGTIPQRLLLLNGDLVRDKTRGGPFNSATWIAALAPDDRAAVETAYLAVLTRRPTPEESAHFKARLAGTRGKVRTERVSDLLWTLINSTEFSWNH
jgi:hypothetical protein